MAQGCQPSDIGVLFGVGCNKRDIYTSVVDKMHFCKIMEQSVLRYRIDVLFDDGCNKCDIYSW
jgi:hypothetical protein